MIECVSLFEINDILRLLHLVEGERDGALHELGALGSLFAHFLFYGECEAFRCDVGEHSLQLFPLCSEHFYTFALVNLILAQHLERLTYASAAYFELEVFLLAVEVALDEAAQFYAIFNPYALFVVDLHHDAVVGAGY